MVAAAAALLKSVDRELSPASIRSILTGTALDIDEPGWDHRTAAGLLNVEDALRSTLPSRVAITSPALNEGFAGDTWSIVGTAVDPSFIAYELSYVAGDEGTASTWTSLSGPQSLQVLDGTLGEWDVRGLADGVYTLRLAVTRRTGQPIEDRRRVYIDQTPPEITLHMLDSGLVGNRFGIIGDVETDDLSITSLTVVGSSVYNISDRFARRHGLAWEDALRGGGMQEVSVTATNAAGLSTTIQRTIDIPEGFLNTAFVEAVPLGIPHGFLLPKATDFDGDGLLELTLNRYQDGWLGDTLSTYEWNGDGFTLAHQIIANVFPRDVGDADGDGLLELLTQVGGATLVLEQAGGEGYPTTTAFLDTTGLANPFDEASAFGARITDLDQDGRGEYLVHNTKAWRVLEYDGNGFAEVARLENPTGVTASELDTNALQEPKAVIA